MSGTICLQGGAEFGRSCRDMDREVVTSAPVGPLVVLAGAAAPGRDHDTAGRNAVRYYAQWVGDEVVAAPDPRVDLDACLEALHTAAMIVLPGGSPRRLLEVLDGPVGEAVRERYAAGATLSGASAGAMVLCEHTVVPDGGGAVVEGMGLAPGLALPHFTGEDRWSERLPDDLLRWGLPECGGVLLREGEVRAVGAGDPVALDGRGRREIGRGWSPLAALLG